MTLTLSQQATPVPQSGTDRFRLSRAGVLNVWQYDEQVFDLAQGRLLLRGANGAGKSKTLEMLLPFALDGDKARITASAKHHTSLLWLMTDGVPGGNRVGYVWVEFVRTAEDGAQEAFTCGVGIRASASARTATAWHFATGRRVGHDLFLEDEAGPLSRPRLEEVLGADGVVFQRAADYKAHVGRALFGLDPAAYDEVLRLLYWLRQPQVGEDIEPAKLAQQLSQALPQLEERTVRSAGDTFDEMAAVGEQLDRRAVAAEALAGLAEAYRGYASAVVSERARAAADTLRRERRLRSEVGRLERRARAVDEERAQTQEQRETARAGLAEDDARLRTLEDSPEFRDQRRLAELEELAQRQERIAHDAEGRRGRQQDMVHRREESERSRARSAQRRVSDQIHRLQELDRRQRRSVPGSAVPVLHAWDGQDPDAADRLTATEGSLDSALEGLGRARSDLGRRLAGVGVVREAVDRAETAAAAQRQAEGEADRAEARWETARLARLGAQEETDTARDDLWAALTTWSVSAAAPASVPDDLVPEVLTPETLRDLSPRAREAASPQLGTLRAQLAAAMARGASVRTEIMRLTSDRAEVEAKQEPEPPAPPLPRTPRTDGLPLWRVVDFAEHLGAQARAGLEAALQASGLLDAWLRPDGRLLDARHRDVTLLAMGEGSGQDNGLLGALVPSLPPGSDLTTEDVCRVLASVGSGADPRVPAWARTDGTWRLGPAHGRAGKDAAQYIGATARAAERARRLDLIDTALAEQGRLAEEADRAAAAAREAIEAVETWVAEVPSGQAFLQAATRLDERLTTEEREEQDNRRAQDAAHRARSTAAEARAALGQVATAQDLPADRPALEAVEHELRDLDQGLREAEGQDPDIREQLRLWREAVAELVEARAVLTAEDRAAAESGHEAAATRAAAEALRASVGDSVQELRRKIAAVTDSRTAHATKESAANDRLEELLAAHGEARANLEHARAGLAEHVRERSTTLAALGSLESVPGLLAAAQLADDLAPVLPRLASLPSEEAVPRDLVAAVSSLAEGPPVETTAAANRVWRAHNEASSGPAADHEPAVAEFGDLLAVSGRDDAGEDAIAPLSRRVTATVARDRDLLTEREKHQFERHILGELGDAIRQCRRDAEELVAAMNEQLAQVTTSQGIRVKLDWKLRGDVPAEARESVGLLNQPLGALLPEERATLRDALHRLIEASRAERPELSYTEHLAAALDYRTWSEFTIRYTRPEGAGQWERLHRRSPLSQGEQKVLCYLPLFAAAAAHFTSLAGAAPHAPRLVLLDDAFPKIDVRTHPLLFGLLVQLDLDFVITSERLWGDHETVPSLAIYEALRDPAQRGIAQYRYHWDGRALQALG